MTPKLPELRSYRNVAMRNSLILLAIAGFLLLVAAAQAQQAVNNRPDAEIPFSLTASGRTAILDNRFLGCTTFQFSYSVDTFNAASIQMDEAANVAGVAGSWAKFGTAIGSLPAGTTLPLTNTTGGAASGFKYIPFVSINLNSVGGGPGTITGHLQCWKPLSQQDSVAAAGNVVNQGNAPWLTTINGPFATNNAAATVFTPRASLRVELEPSQIFIDTFDNGLDTTTKWSATNGGVGSAAPTNGGVDGGSTTLSGGTALNAFSLLKSLNKFGTTEPGYLYVTMRINIESPVLTTGYRFWGIGTTPSSPTIANPVIDGIGYDITTTGHLRAVTYAGTGGTTGAITVIKDLFGAGQPTDAAAHKYFLWTRGDTSYYAIDTFDNVVASFLTGASGPNVNTLPLVAEVISNSGTTETLVVNAIAVGDTARNAVIQVGTDNPGFGVVPIPSAVVENGHILKPFPGNLYGLTVTSTVNGLVMIFNSTTVPGNGAVTPIYCLRLTPDSGGAGTFGINFLPGPPAAFSTGISWAMSTGTNCASLTLSATAWGTGMVK